MNEARGSSAGWSKPPLWALAMSLFYTVIIGLVVGKVIIKSTQGSGGDGGQTVLSPVASVASWELLGRVDGESDQAPWVVVKPVMPQAEHAARYARERLAEMGFGPERGLVQVQVQNLLPDGDVELSDVAGTLVLEDDAGRNASLPLPDTKGAKPEAVRLALIQRKLEGPLPAGHERSGWKVMERPVDVAKAKRGEFRLADGRVIVLEPAAIGRR